jgi:hypothetical protein
MIYFAYVYPYLCYCLSVWGSAADVHVNKVKKKSITKEKHKVNVELVAFGTCQALGKNASTVAV